MAASKAGSVAGDHKHRRPTVTTRRRHHRDRALDSKAEKPTLDQLRDVRAAYFSKSTDDRLKEAGKPSAQEVRSRGGGIKSHHTSSRTKLAQSKSHRRRDSSNDYVYSRREHKRPTSTLRDESTSEASSEDTLKSSDAIKNTTTARRPHRKLSRAAADGKVQPRRKADAEHDLSSRPLTSAALPFTRNLTSSRKREVASVHPSLPRSTTTSIGRDPKSKPGMAHRRDSALSTTGDVRSVLTSGKAGSRPPSLLTSLFRSKSTPSVVPMQKVECLTCGDDEVETSKAAKLACGHCMCHSCLKRIFTMSIADPAHMPPKCCTSKHIPLKYVQNLFSTKFKILWNKKYEEYMTKNRVYCPARGCGEWIKPSNIHMDKGRKYGRCSKCRTKICILCNRKWHTHRECPNDEATAKFIETAKEKGWQSCFNCKAMVELKEGCNHMTCRCTAEFCMLCGLAWKTCDCPWFNHTTVADVDRLNHMRVPYNINIVRRPVGPIFDRVAVEPQQALNPALTYQQELDARRRQERTDEALARRLQRAALGLENEDNMQQRHATEVRGFGNAGTHFMNEGFMQTAANLVIESLGEQFGRRGERESGRRRRTDVHGGFGPVVSTGLAPDAFGTESVLGIGPATAPSLATLAMRGTASNGPELPNAGRQNERRIGDWLGRVQ